MSTKGYPQPDGPPCTFIANAIIGRDVPGQRGGVVQEQVRGRGHHPSGSNNVVPRVFIVVGATSDAAPAQLPQSMINYD